MTDGMELAAARIFVVDDHSIVRHGICALLSGEPGFTVCGQAGSYEEAAEALPRVRPDLLLLDITLKDRNGLDLIEVARRANPAIRTVVLSMHDEADFAERALRAGAQGYVMKENADEILVDALRAVLDGKLYVSEAVSARMVRRFVGAEASEPESGPGGIESLTEREREIFECIGRGMTSRKIAEKFDLSARTVEVHRAHIKRKLGCDDAAQLVREAVRWLEAGR